MPEENNRRDIDPRVAEHGTAIMELRRIQTIHSEQLVRHDAQFEHLAPKMEMLEVKGRLEDRMGKLENGLEAVARELRGFGETLTKSLNRMADQNEENMQEKAQMEREKASQEREAHKRELELRDAQIAKFNQERENGKWQNKLKENSALIVAGGIVAAFLFKLLSFIQPLFTP